MTIRDLFREFVVAKRRSRQAFELATVTAYQTVRAHWMTKGKKGRMPSFASLITEGEGRTFRIGDSKEKARAVMQMLAASAGVKPTPVNRQRIVRGPKRGE